MAVRLNVRFNVRQNIRLLVNLFQVALLLMLLVAVALVAAIVTMHFAIHGAEVEVPPLKGMTVADALSETAGLGLNLDVDNRYYSGQVAPGHILTQSPAAGTIVRRAWTVRVSESLGPQKVDVPSTVGQTARVAAMEMQRAGLEVGAQAVLPYDGAPGGTVLAQDPPAHAQDIEKPAVSLLVAAPNDEPPDGWVMPDFTGWTIDSVEAALAKVGVKAAPPDFVNVGVAPVGNGSAGPQMPVKPDSVVAQEPVAGMRVDQSVTVRLAVAK
ncbi:MAG TPA: PASTA domain-containing protein [Terracidiphilus sp.]|nr:PASTA domain-containing protein [Terracidiphilus sp.]